MVDRKTRCLLGWAVVWERTQEAIQQMLDEAPKAKWYYSDGLDTYARLFGITLAGMKFPKASPIRIRSRQIMQNYDIIWPAWLASHVVSRVALMPLRCAIRLFAFCYNSRQLYKQRYPNYPAHVHGLR